MSCADSALALLLLLLLLLLQPFMMGVLIAIS